MNLPLSIFAEVTSQEATWIFVVGSGIVAGLFLKISALKKSLVEEVSALVRAQQTAPPSSVNVQQPFTVQEAERFASANAFSRHCTADHAAHAEIRENIVRVERDMTAKVSEAKDEILKAGVEREDRLNDAIKNSNEAERGRMDKVIEQLGEMKGMVHHLVVHHLVNVATTGGGGKKGGGN